MRKRIKVLGVMLVVCQIMGVKAVLGLEYLESSGTRYIPADTEIGTWDAANRIYTLTQNVNETVQIDEDNLTLDGNGNTITGLGSEPGVSYVSGSGVYVPGRSGVTLQNLHISGFAYGIKLESSNNIRIEDTCAELNDRGIWLQNSNNSSITNTLSNSNHGGGLLILGCQNIIVSGSTFANQSTSTGVWVEGSSDITLVANTITQNLTGLHLFDTCLTTVISNTLSENSFRGLASSSSSDGTIYNNNFVDNFPQVSVLFGSGNVFNLTDGAGGNYWSDWTGPDADADGFVDNPYVFDGGQDNYPWTLPFGETSVAAIPAGPDIPVDLVNPETGETAVTMQFDNVTEGGISTVTETTPSDGQGPPQGFKVGSPATIFNIITTAQFDGEIIIGINYDGLNYSDEANLKIFHFDADLGWIDVTVPSTAEAPNPDTVNKIIYGRVTSLSPFALFEPANEPPQVIITSPDSGSVVPVNQGVSLEATIADPDTGDQHTAVWTIRNENWTSDYTQTGTVSDGTVADTVSFPDAGIYYISIEVTDDAGASAQASTVNDATDMPAFIVVYNPNGGFVTGGGWIWSPPEALDLAPEAEGKANYGFVSKYQTGTNVPSGNTEFRFKAGGFSFKSTAYDWLVVAGTRAKFKGDGVIDGMDEIVCKFMLTAVDGGDEDRFRIKIWDPSTDWVIYDNKRGADDEAELDESMIIGGGSIVIHKTN